MCRAPHAAKLPPMPRSHALGAAALIASAAALCLAAPAPAQMPYLGTYDLRLSVTMTSEFAFEPDPVGCAGRFPLGTSGSGEEVLELKSPKPVRVQFYRPPDTVPAVTRKDFKPGFELTGESRRTGAFTRVACQESEPGYAAGCVGRFPVRHAVQLSFYEGKWQMGTQSGPTTRELIPSCSDDVFDWDGAVDRTGIVLIETGEGPAPASKLKARSFTLVARHVQDRCDAPYLGIGTCRTEWTYKANFRKVKPKRKRR